MRLLRLRLIARGMRHSLAECRVRLLDLSASLAEPSMPPEFDCFDLDATITQIAAAIGATPPQVRAAVDLLDAGNTLPFIARYRKEATRGLDETALRAIEDALAAARELAQRKRTILKTIDRPRRPHRRAPPPDRTVRRQADAGTALSAVQAETPHPRDDRPRARARTAGRDPVEAGSGSIARARSRAALHRSEEGSPRRRRGAPRRLRHRRRTLGRRRRTQPLAQPAGARLRPGRLHGETRQERPRAPSSRLTSIIASRPSASPRIGCWPCSAARPKDFSTSASQLDDEFTLRKLRPRLSPQPAVRIPRRTAAHRRRLLHAAAAAGGRIGDAANAQRAGRRRSDRRLRQQPAATSARRARRDRR